MTGTAASQVVHVDTTVARDGYDVVIGAGLLDELHRFLPDAAHCVIITDDRVSPLHGTRVVDQLRARGRRADLLDFPAGEGSKSRASWIDLSDRMLALGVGRDGCVVALGGGVTGDLAGFVAATYMRGLPVVQVPTTLLAMIDAAVGGKTGVDTPAGKNLIGAFHHPHAVIADPLVLRTLPVVHVRAGLAEAIKHGAILDRAYLDWIAAAADRLLALEPDAVEHLIARSVALKTGVVADDPREHGRRAILNFGHTVAHALELNTSYALLHGLAVAVGMRAEARVGERAGITRAGTADCLAAVLARCQLPVSIAGVRLDGILDAMRLDKKARAAQPRFALLAEPGRCVAAADGKWTHGVAADVVSVAVREVIDDDHDV